MSSQPPRKDSSQQGNAGNASHIVVVFGASGDLAKKKIYPALWSLFKKKLMPNDTQIIGYARSPISVAEIRQRCQPFYEVKSGEEALADEFWKINSYVQGSFKTQVLTIAKLNKLRRGGLIS